MAPVVVAANSRGGYSRLPTEQRVTTSSCSARAQRSRESPTRCRMVAVVPMRTCWSRPAATVATPMAPMDGSNGTEASDCVDVPPVRLCDRQRRRPWIESLGAPVPVWRAIKTLVASGYRPAPETPLKQPNSRAHRHTRRASREQGRERRSSQRKRVSRARRAARARPRHDTAHTGRRSVSTEITLTYCPVCTLVFRAPSDSPTRRGS